MTETDFNPDWVSSPGSTILDILESRGLSVDSFCQNSGISRPFFNRLLRGYERIDTDIASSLEQTLDVPSSFWISRDSQYLDSFTRKTTHAQRGMESSWAQKFPISDMKRWGWLKHSSKKHYAEDLLKFFSVSTPDEWNLRFGHLCEAISFKKTEPDYINHYAIIAWLYKGQIDAEQISVQPLDRNKLRESLEYIKRLTWFSDPSTFLPKLKKCLAGCGVALVVEQSPRGSTATGATWVDREGRATIIVSDRYKSDDHFWFAVMHEVSHLLLHDCSRVIVEMSSELQADKREKEANEFAKNVILSGQQRDILLSSPLSYKRIKLLAQKWRIAPGLIVGQLQHDKVIRYNEFNRLKRNYSWKGVF